LPERARTRRRGPRRLRPGSRALFGPRHHVRAGCRRSCGTTRCCRTAEPYVRSKQLAREARGQIEAAGGPYIKSKTGRVFKHPGVEDARQHERDAHEYGKALLLNPESRRRAGVKDDGGGDSPFDF
jgi:hypothetical protein